MLDDVRLFLTIARQGSLSAAAKTLDMPVSTLSRRLSALEQGLGYGLLHRNARGFVLTEQGEHLFSLLEQDVRLLEQKLAHLLTAASQRELHVHCPINLINGPLKTLIRDFLVEHSEIELHLYPDNDTLNLSDRKVDLAIRVGRPEDSSLYFKPLAEIRVRLLGHVSQGDSPADQTLIMPYGPTQVQMSQVQFDDFLSGYRRVVRTRDITLAADLVAAGVGVGLIPMTEIARLDNLQDLRYLDGESQMLSRQLYLVWPQWRTLSGPAASFVDMLMAKVQASVALRGQSIVLGKT